MLPGIIGTLQATEAIKVLTGIGDPMIGRFLHYDALKANFKTFNIRKDPDCGICGKKPTIKTISKIYLCIWIFVLTGDKKWISNYLAFSLLNSEYKYGIITAATAINIIIALAADKPTWLL